MLGNAHAVLSRRAFVQSLAGAAFGLGLPRDATAERAARADRLERIGLQLYTVRRELTQDFEGTLAKVAAIGYREVEFAVTGYFHRPPAAAKAALDRNGLANPSAHVPISDLREGWGAVIERARAIGPRYLVVAWIPAEERTLDGYKRIADLFNRAGAKKLSRSTGADYRKEPAEDFASVVIESGTEDGYQVLGEATTSWSFMGPGLRLSAELLGPEYSMSAPRSGGSRTASWKWCAASDRS